MSSIPPPGVPHQPELPPPPPPAPLRGRRKRMAPSAARVGAKGAPVMLSTATRRRGTKKHKGEPNVPRTTRWRKSKTVVRKVEEMSNGDVTVARSILNDLSNSSIAKMAYQDQYTSVDVEVMCEIVNSLREFFQAIKSHATTNDGRMLQSTVLTALAPAKEANLGNRVAQLLGVRPNTLGTAIERRERVFMQAENGQVKREHLSDLYESKKNQRSDALPEETKEKVINFFFANSRPSSNSKNVIKVQNKDGMKEDHLIRWKDRTDKELFTEFCKSHPEVRLGFSKFNQLKPPYVRMTKTKTSTLV